MDPSTLSLEEAARHINRIADQGDEHSDKGTALAAEWAREKTVSADSCDRYGNPDAATIESWLDALRTQGARFWLGDALATALRHHGTYHIYTLELEPLLGDDAEDREALQEFAERYANALRDELTRAGLYVEVQLHHELTGGDNFRPSPLMESEMHLSDRVRDLANRTLDRMLEEQQ